MADPSERAGSGGTSGRYCNHVFIRNSQWDFMFDFFQLVPIGNPGDEEQAVEAHPIERIIMSPEHARAFLEAFQTNLTNWEKAHGHEIPDLRGGLSENAAQEEDQE